MLWPIYCPAQLHHTLPHTHTHTHTDTDQVERDIVQMLHTPLQVVVSLQELKEASEQDPSPFLAPSLYSE